MLDERCAGEGGNRYRPHIDPIRGRQILGRHVRERVAIEDQRHDPQIQRAGAKPQHQRHEEQWALQTGEDARGRYQHRQNSDGSGRHDADQPATVEALG
jgi:hypothetical protein